MPPAPAPAVSPDVAQVVADLTAVRALDPARGPALLAEFLAASDDPTPAALARFLHARDLLTPYQMDRTAVGQAAKLAVGPYLLQAPLGGGSSVGSVFKAVRAADRQTFAVRVLPLRSLWKVARAKRQMAAVAAVPPHPAVVPFADLDSADGRHYLAWPFAAGTTLERTVRRSGPLDPPLAARLFADLADGLAACHAAGVSHGLVRPSGILVAPGGKAKLLDLGVGAVLADNMDDGPSILDTISMASVSAGMVDYTAPETALDPAARTPAADAYALGCCLYFALSGAPPFPDGTAVQKMVGHQSRTPVPVQNRNPDVPAELAELVVRLLAKAPADRPADLTEVRDALHEIAGSFLMTGDEFAASSASHASSASRASSASAAGGSDTDTARPPVAPPMRSPVPQRPTDAADTDGLIDFDLGGGGSTNEAGIRWNRRSASGRSAAAPQAPPAAASAETPPTRSARTPTPANVPPPPVGLSGAHRTVDRPSGSFPPAAPVGLSGHRTSGVRADRPPVVVPPLPPFAAHGFRGLSRSLKFWKPTADVVQLSVFGPPEVAPGQRVQFQVCAHLPDAFAGVSTLCRALRHDADLLGTGFVDRGVPRGQRVGVHLALENAGVAKSQVAFAWQGQTTPHTFEVFVPWESPAGLTAGVLTAAVGDDRAAAVPLHFVVRPRGM